MSEVRADTLVPENELRFMDQLPPVRRPEKT